MPAQCMKVLCFLIIITALSEWYAVMVGALPRANSGHVQKHTKAKGKLETILYSERYLDQSTVEEGWRRRHHFTATDDGKTCLVIEAAILLDIQYTAEEKQRASRHHTTDKFNTSGTCSNTDGINTITIRFLDTWSLTIHIGRTTSHSYEWTRVELNLLLEEDRFPNLSPEIDKRVHINKSLSGGTFEVTKNFDSLYCSGPVQIQMNDDIFLTFIDMRYRAFGNNLIDTIRYKDVQKCRPRRVKRNDGGSNNSSNTDGPPTTTIALSASGGLVSFIILLCCIYFCCNC